MKINKHILPILFLGALLGLTPLALTSCQEEPAKINIKMVSDYSQIIEAINRTDRSLTEKVSLVEAALSGGFADSQAARQMLQQAVSSLTGTVSERLAALEAAVRSQTASLETKLTLIEAAVTAGFADRAAQQALTREAVETLSGTTAERLAQIQTALKGQTASLEAKLGLIETAITEGLADEKAGQELLLQAVSSLTGTAAERLQAIEAAVESQSASLAAKLDLIDLAVENRLADNQEALALVRQAVESLDGTLEEKLDAVGEAVKSQTASLETKLSLIEAAVRGGFADDAAQEELLLQALKTLGGSLESKLAAVAAAVGNQASNLSSRLELIEQAVSEGFVADTVRQALIRKAIESLDGTLAEKLAAIDTVLMSQTDSLTTKLALIEAALEKGLSDEATALGQIELALSSSLKDGVDSVAKALRQINTTTLQGHLTSVLRNIAAALTDNGPIDYRPILMAIQQTLKELSGENMLNGHEYVVMGPNGLKWATCNVGADNPWDNGDYFAWGETEPYYSSLNPPVWKTGKEGGYVMASNKYYNQNYNPEDSNSNPYTKYIPQQKDTLTLEYEDDAARQNWGGTWRMPTNDELKWLKEHSQLTWTDNYNGTGVRGVIVTSTFETYNGNQIFLPVAGYWKETQRYESGTFGYCLYFWSSSTDVKASAKAMMMEGTDRSISCSTGDKPRYYGLSVRPVSD